MWNMSYLRLLESMARETTDEGQLISLAWRHQDWIYYEIERWGEIMARVYPERRLRVCHIC